MVELTKENFDAEVLEYSGVVFVDFWSPKCEPCLGLLPEVEALAEKNAERAKFCKLDTAGNKRLAIAQKVMGIPTLVFYKNGEKVFTFDKEAIEGGAMSNGEVQAKLDELLG
jgi:thioredoxin 1